MVKTSEVFTPTRRPVITSVKRDSLWGELEDYIEQGGVFLSVLGTTKLGKSTLITEVIQPVPFSAYIPGQSITAGSEALWSLLSSKLGIPVSSVTGKVSSDKSKWGFMARFGISIPGLATNVASSAGGEHLVSDEKSKTYELDVPSAIRESLSLLAIDARSKGLNPPVIVVDDFHFIVDEKTRREIILALRPIAELDVTVILATLPGRDADSGFSATNIGGRHKVVDVPLWRPEELKEIATTGFEKLNVTAPSGLIDRLAEEAFGSPQLMQEFCLNLCRKTNGIRESQAVSLELQPPDNWRDFFRLIDDPQSKAWLVTLGVGPKQRKPRVAKADAGGFEKLDGYQLILWALHNMGAKRETSFTKLRETMQGIPDVAQTGFHKFSFEGKVNTMHVLASREMEDALAEAAPSLESDGENVEDSTYSAEAIERASVVPQPVFEARLDSKTLVIRILDPLLSFTLKWHPETFTQTS